MVIPRSLRRGRRRKLVLSKLAAFAALVALTWLSIGPGTGWQITVGSRAAYAQKANGEACLLPSECSSGRCVVTCQAQVRTDTIAANSSTVCFAGPQTCDMPRDGSVPRESYFVAQMPPEFLDISPPSGQVFARKTADSTPLPKKTDGAVCALPDECASGRCQFFKCEAQPPPAMIKPDGAACALPAECLSARCQFFKCEAQPPPPAERANGAACFMPGECASRRCHLFKCEAQPACEPPESTQPVTPSDPATNFHPFWSNVGFNEGRLRSDLRDAAREKDPGKCALPLAAIHYGLGGPDETALGQAFADLSVTGKDAFLDGVKGFKVLLPDATDYCRTMPALAASVAPSCGTPAIVPSERALIDGCRTALTRAYRVANFLRVGQALPLKQKKKHRRELGWIAVSGEDDSPHRPVNVPSSNYPQYDISVSVKNSKGDAIVVRSRYIVAQQAPPVFPDVRKGQLLAEELRPSIPPDSEVLLFLHGMDSRAEEATDITSQLLLLRQRTPGRKNLVVISVDLPTSGYADNLDHFRISPLETVGTPKDLLGNPVAYAVAAKSTIAAPDFSFTGETPLLDFIENFAVRFVETLDTGAMPGVKNQIKAVMGGSLGGNITFRLGRRCRSERVGPCSPGETTNMSWLPNFIVWSPASIWNSLGESTDVLKHLGPLTALLAANNVDPADPDDLLTPERAGLRREFFGSWDQPIIPILVPVAQSDTWQSDFFPCKKSMIVGARLDRHETYDPLFLRWHWRLGAEQLLYSHQTIDARTPGQPRFLSNVKPMLLACGTEDRILFNDICGATQRTAPWMTTTPGRAIFLQETGHSVDNERREYFARQIIEFIDVGPTPAVKKADGAACALPDECASGRCQLFKCEAQPLPVVKKANGAACALPDECASGRCQFFKCEAQP